MGSRRHRRRRACLIQYGKGRATWQGLERASLVFPGPEKPQKSWRGKGGKGGKGISPSKLSRKNFDKRRWNFTLSPNSIFRLFIIYYYHPCHPFHPCRCRETRGNLWQGYLYRDQRDPFHPCQRPKSLRRRVLVPPIVTVTTVSPPIPVPIRGQSGARPWPETGHCSPGSTKRSRRNCRTNRHSRRGG
jgi:hypothetical protein